MTNDKSRLVTVCAECLTAACWRGIFMCQKARDADVTRKTVAELEALGLESADYYARNDDDYPEPS